MYYNNICLSIVADTTLPVHHFFLSPSCSLELGALQEEIKKNSWYLFNPATHEKCVSAKWGLLRKSVGHVRESFTTSSPPGPEAQIDLEQQTNEHFPIVATSNRTIGFVGRVSSATASLLIQ